jgi:hypothetical protein
MCYHKSTYLNRICEHYSNIKFLRIHSYTHMIFLCQNRSTQDFLAVVTRDRSAIGDYCEVDDVRDPPYNPNTKGSDF